LASVVTDARLAVIGDVAIIGVYLGSGGPARPLATAGAVFCMPSVSSRHAWRWPVKTDAVPTPWPTSTA
jgi:hypothetical protein